MMKRVVHIIIWLVLAAWFTAMMSFVSQKNSSLICKQLVISITDSSEVKFITEDMVRESILHSGFNTQGYPIEGIRIRDIELMLENNPYVDNTEVYTNVEGDLMVDIDQRKPLLRVMPEGKNGYYIDSEGVILSLSENYSPMILLVTGSIHILEIQNDKGMRSADLEANAELQDLIDFAEFVAKNSFWSGQIVQLYRTENGDFEIIPRVGAHQILFGTMDNFEVKLRNLKLLYDQGLKQYGWNSYNKINLKYSNQIICTKR